MGKGGLLLTNQASWATIERNVNPHPNHFRYVIYLPPLSSDSRQPERQGMSKMIPIIRR